MPHLIVAHEVTNVGSDRAQLTAMSRKARQASGCEEVTVLADSFAQCDDRGPQDGEWRWFSLLYNGVRTSGLCRE
jgi:hypothetical protein